MSVIPVITSTREQAKTAVLKQVEFYFGDSNYLGDKFLRAQATANHGWVAIDVVSSFKRMQQFTDKDMIVEALRMSKELLEVNAEGTMVRRIKPVTENASVFHNSIYAKGFPEERPGLQDAIEEFFNTVGTVKCIRMRRDQSTKAFKKSVFVELASHEEAIRVADMSLTFEDQPLAMMLKEAYVLMKCAEKGIEYDGSAGPKGKTSKPKGDQSAYPKRQLLGFSEYTFTGADLPATSNTEETAADIAESNPEEKVSKSLPWRPLQHAVEGVLGSRVGFIKFDASARGQGWIELNRPDAGKIKTNADLEDVGAGEKKLVFADGLAILRVIADDEEANYWKERPFSHVLRSFQQGGNSHAGRGRGGGRGGRGGRHQHQGGNKRSVDDANDNGDAPEKKVRVE